MASLAGVSVILVVASVLMFVASVVVDRRMGSGPVATDEIRSLRMMRPSNVAVLLLLYASIAFSQEIALEWLAAIATVTCFAASLLRRGLAMLAARGEARAKVPATVPEGDVPGEPTSEGDAVAGAESIEEMPLVVARHMLEILCDILIYLSALDLVLLFVMALVEKVIPYYVGLAIG